MRKQRKSTEWLKTGAIVGVAGAGSVLLLDQVLTRVPSLATRPGVTALVRLLGAFLLGLGARRLGASDRLLAGIVGGPVLYSTLDLSTRLISERRVHPPAAGGVRELGQPWSPTLIG